MKPAPAIPAALHQLMAQLGPKWGTNIGAHARQTLEAFSALHRDAPKEARVERDLPYGAHPRHVLDLYAPRGAKDAPVVVFAHGGAFVDGHKMRGEEIYANVGWYFARNGVLLVNMEYRLAPEFPYPAATDDVAAAVAWVRANIARYGGDPKKLFVMGHSAGACHVGLYAYDPRFGAVGANRVRGLIVVSGRVRAENLPENPNARKVEAYFGTDAGVMKAGSVVEHVTADSPPAVIGFGEWENPLIDVHCTELLHRLSQVQRKTPRVVRLAGFTHSATIAHFNTAEERLGREILDFIAENT
jgi:acetyl esterase/lipase